jgi:hypothetical protein
MSTPLPSSLAAALQFARYHWSVIPMRARDKRPLIKWLEYQHRLATENEINEWYQKWATANVGIVTGVISGLVVLDIDPRHGGEQSLAQWEKVYEPLPLTQEVRTGGGGRHVYFKHPGGVIHNRVGIDPGIDLRGDGGCVVAPPSIHSSGEAYTWVSGHEPGKVALAELPGWLLRLVRSDAKSSGYSLGHWRQLVSKGVAEGERNNTIASLSGHLLSHDIDLDVVRELLLCWNRIRCSPPLDDDEVINTVTSISHLHRHDSPEEPHPAVPEIKPA